MGMKSTQNQFFGDTESIPSHMTPGSTFVDTDAGRMFVAGKSGKVVPAGGSLQEILNKDNTASETNMVLLDDARIQMSTSDTSSPVTNASIYIGGNTASNDHYTGLMVWSKKLDSLSNKSYYGVYAYIEMQSPNPSANNYGGYFKSNVTGAGVPDQVIAAYTNARMNSSNSTGTGFVALLSGLENYVHVEDFGYDGAVDIVLGNRTKIIMDNPNSTSREITGMISILDLNKGHVDAWYGLVIDLQKRGDVDATLNEGAWISLQTDINQAEAEAAGLQAIKSELDLPSNFAGTLEAKELIVTTVQTYENDAAAGIGGVTPGTIYSTAAGDLKIKL